MRTISTNIVTVLILCLTFLGTPVSAQNVEPKGCNVLPIYHLLDFWVAEWNVYVGDDQVGYNRIEKTLDGCAVLEHWVDSDGNAGKSLFFVSDGGEWKQVWVTEWANRPGGVKEKTIVDSAPENGVRFQGSLHHPDVGDWLDRTTLKTVENGEVRQIIETSSDNGKTWEIRFDAIYRRVIAD